MTSPAPGTQGWLDLTVDDATGLRDFYASVLGWTPAPVPMNDGEYEDYAMLVGEQAVGGVCHRRGDNARQPANVWVPYFVVADLAATTAAATEKGATVLDQRTQMTVLRDPAGAVFALWESKPAEE